MTPRRAIQQDVKKGGGGGSGGRVVEDKPNHTSGRASGRNHVLSMSVPPSVVQVRGAHVSRISGFSPSLTDSLSY